MRTLINILQAKELATLYNLCLLLLFACFPFYAIWLAYYLSGRTFAPEGVFFTNGWWFFAVVYWLFLAIIYFVEYMIKENKRLTANTKR